MNVARPPFRGDTSPDLSPECKGADRGTGAVSLYPERDSNPHAARQQGILRSFPIDSGPVQIGPYRGKSDPAINPDSSALVPNEDRTSPEMSPEGKSCARCQTFKPFSEFSRRRKAYQPYCKPCASQNVRDWMERGENRQRLYQNVQASRARYPERSAARKTLNAAVAAGRIVAGPCEVGTDCVGQIQAHHDDYSKPLDVRWLCKRHHEEHHHGRAAA